MFPWYAAAGCTAANVPAAASADITPSWRRDIVSDMPNLPSSPQDCKLQLDYNTRATSLPRKIASRGAILPKIKAIGAGVTIPDSRDISQPDWGI
jgi:hypothetical protein